MRTPLLLADPRRGWRCAGADAVGLIMGKLSVIREHAEERSCARQLARRLHLFLLENRRGET
jgi:hypothetical protein